MTAESQMPMDGPQSGPSDFSLPETATSRMFDRVIVAVGEWSSWLWTILMLLIVYQVVLRYVFSMGSIKLEEIQWHIYAVGFLLGLAFTEVRQRHVRIDVLSEHFPRRVRLRIELGGLLFFLLPLTVFVIWYAVPFVAKSWELNEISAAPDGLPYRWALKSFIVTAFVLLAMAGFSRLTRVWAALRAESR
jgi:TRAP-type mannitol/chloroaromatic compound transport system permease small subunit